MLIYKLQATIEDNGMKVTTTFIEELSVNFIKECVSLNYIKDILIISKAMFLDIVTAKYFVEFITSYLNDNLIFQNKHIIK